VVKIQAEVFWDVIMCAGVWKPTGSGSVIHFTLETELAMSFKMLVSYHSTTQCHDPEDLDLNQICFIHIFIRSGILRQM